MDSGASAASGRDLPGGSVGAELFDSHCHLTSGAFKDDLEEVLARAAAADVTRWVTIASNPDDSRAAMELVGGREGAWCTVGCHPHEAGSVSRGHVAELRELAAHPDVVAIGETGLDYHYDYAPRRRQRQWFDAQLGLGAELGLPVVVHARDADADIAAAIRAAPPGTKGVLHCFTGGTLAFAAAMDIGWYVSLSGIVSFRNFGAGGLVREIPKDRLMVETDSPYLSPVPFRGRRNEPGRVAAVAMAVATLLGEPPDGIARRTTENARRLYGV